MAVKEIVKVWDKGNIIKKDVKFLMKPTKKVRFPITYEEEEIINDLIDTYNKIPCSGIAANQIRYKKKIFIGQKYEDEQDYNIYINPQIDSINESSLQTGPEGCLSIPDLSLNIERYDKITVRYYAIDGKKKVMKLSGYISRLFQHEIEHLEGKLMIGSRIHSGLTTDAAATELFYDLVKLLFGEVICPYYKKTNVVPFSDEFQHQCTSKKLNGNCEHLVDLYCKNSARTYMSCKYFDKDSVL